MKGTWRTTPAIQSQAERRGRILILQDQFPTLSFSAHIASFFKRREDVQVVCAYVESDLSLQYDFSNATKELRRKLKDVEHMAEWADLLLVTCISADTIAKMLHGISDSGILQILRCWNVSKKAAIIPGMSQSIWDNPMTKKQLNKIRRKWNWISIYGSFVWDPKQDIEIAYRDWTGMQECVDTLENQIDLLMLGHDHIPSKSSARQSLASPRAKRLRLPLELWTMILDFAGDWELAKTLGIFTNLPVPAEWQGFPSSIGSDFMPELEWTVLTGSLQDIIFSVQTGGPPRSLSRLCVKLIFKFARTDILSYLETNHKDLFWSQLGHTLIPTKASAVYGQTAILDWWLRSPTFLTKEYNADSLDLASKSGYTHVLQWWYESRLPLRYTDAALEQASSQGHIDVLEWWRNVAQLSHQESNTQAGRKQLKGGRSHMSSARGTDYRSLEVYPLVLKVGKSLIYAAQNGQAATIDWWMSSGIPTVHEEAVARAASANGHVSVLQLWKEIKGEKMQYDNQVLVGPTRNGHVEVLEWWKKSGYRVEYKTCDIEEALEDSVGGPKETSIRNWWALNGLNLGVGTSEWMKVKVL
ncbi:MAG: hypothetical protein Q9174_002176 [Haloplaca sp. 1 TL-2023]